MESLECRALIALLRAAMENKQTSVPDGVNWDRLYMLAKMHRLIPLIYSAVDKNSIPPELCKEMESTYLRAIFINTQFDNLAQQISDVLSAKKITHVFLKGICLKKDYPIPALRTMCDLDVLVYPKDFPVIRKEMKLLGGKATDGDGNHRSYRFARGVTVEFHPNLIHYALPAGTEINPGWQYVTDPNAEGITQMTPEGFYLNMMCHLASHFVSGGVGVRYILDIWVCNHLRTEKYDRQFVEQELERFELLDFARNIEALSEAWLGGGEMTPILSEMEEYIFRSGVQGNSRISALNALSFSEGESHLSALRKKIFFPREDLETRYDWVGGRTWLLPAAWFVRCFRGLTRRGGIIQQWNRELSKYSKQEIQENKQMFQRFGIHKKA